MTKWLVVLAVVVVALWLWRRGTALPGPARSGQTGRGQRLPMMAACAHCGLHLPAADAVHAPQPGGGTLAYCCTAHRNAGPREHQQ